MSEQPLQCPLRLHSLRWFPSLGPVVDSLFPLPVVLPPCSYISFTAGKWETGPGQDQCLVPGLVRGSTTVVETGVLLSRRVLV